MFLKFFSNFFTFFQIAANLRPIHPVIASAMRSAPAMRRLTAAPNSASQSAAPPSASGGI